MHSRKSSADSSDICFQTGLKIGNELSFKPHQVFGKKPSQQLESTPFDLRKKYECLKESHPYHKELHLVKQAIIKPTYIDHEANQSKLTSKEPLPKKMRKRHMFKQEKTSLSWQAKEIQWSIKNWPQLS